MDIFIVSIEEYGKQELRSVFSSFLKDNLPALSVESLVSMELIA